jgi:hypothetical protein
MENKHEWFRFTTRKALAILIYYGILFCIALPLALTGLLYEYLLTSYSIIEKSIIAGIGFSIIGSVIFYSKKIYKACVNLDFTVPVNEEDKIREFGITAYFIFRPLFAIVFSFLLILLLKLGIKIISVAENSIINDFILLTSFLSFFCGYSSGDILDIFESKGKQMMSKVFNNSEI